MWCSLSVNIKEKGQSMITQLLKQRVASDKMVAHFCKLFAPSSPGWCWCSDSFGFQRWSLLRPSYFQPAFRRCFSQVFSLSLVSSVVLGDARPNNSMQRTALRAAADAGR